MGLQHRALTVLVTGFGNNTYGEDVMCINLHDRVMPRVVQLGQQRGRREMPNSPQHGDESLSGSHRTLCCLAHNALVDNQRQRYTALETAIVGIERHVRLLGHFHSMNLMHAVRHAWLPHTEGVLD